MALILPSLRCQCLDFSKGYRDSGVVPVPPGEITSPIGLAEALGNLTCSNGHRVEVTEAPGIFYHPGRKKWVVYYGKRYFGNRDVSFDRTAGALRLGNYNLEFQGGVDFVDTDRLCFAKGTMVLNRFEDKKKKKSEETIRPATVVRPEYLDLVDLDALAATPTRTPSGHWLFKISLLDARQQDGHGFKPRRIEYEYVLPDNQFETIEDLHVEVWPDISYECWRTFWIAMERDPCEAANQYVFEVFGCTKRDLGRRLAVGSLQPRAQYHILDGRPRVVALANRSRDCGGAFLLLDPPSGQDLPANAAHPPIIAIDFGTARTAIGIPGAAGMKTNILAPDDNSSRATDAALHMGLNHFGRAAIRAQVKQHSDQTVWVPTRDFPPASAGEVRSNVTCVGVIPSLLYVPSEKSDATPFVDFSIPAPKKVVGDPTKIESNLKWRVDAPSQGLRENYLKAALLLAVAQAIRNRPSKDYLVRFSFPLAFGKSQVDTLEGAMANAAAWVGTCSGVNIRVSIGGMDESSCAREACGASFVGTWVLTADLGGGTLDLSLWDMTSPGGDDSSPSTSAMRACDSVFFGADILTERWSKKVCPNTPLAHLQYDIFDKGWAAEVQRAKNDASSSAGCADAVRGIDAFFDAVVEYVSRFIAGTAKKLHLDAMPVVWVVLLGSGWLGHEASHEYEADLDSFKKIIETKISKRIKQIAGYDARVNIYPDVLRKRREKAAVVLGLLSLPSASSPSEITAPNGLDEQQVDSTGTVVKRVEWFQFVGRRGVPIPRGTAVLNSPRLTETIEKYVPSFVGGDAGMIAQLNHRRAIVGASRERPVINDLYCYFLRDKIVED